MVFAAIVAGGIGSRMNISSVPKQFLPLAGKPIIIHTLEKFLSSKKLDYIYIGVHQSWISHMKDLLDEYSIRDRRIRISSGGKDRNSTIFNIIFDIEKEFGESDEHVIVTHDSVRPFVTLKMIEKNIEAALKYGACGTVIPAVDTIVVSVDGKNITDIPDRSCIYQSQTPQSFNISLLKKLYSGLTEEEKESLTDACKICFFSGAHVELIRGDVSNMKITTVSDYRIADAVAKEKCDDSFPGQPNN